MDARKKRFRRVQKSSSSVFGFFPFLRRKSIASTTISNMAATIFTVVSESIRALLYG
jgi:hypothetical protein